MAEPIIAIPELSALQAADAGQADSAQRVSPPPAALPKPLRTVLDTLANARAALAERSARRHELATMLRMTDQELHDLGIDREEVPRIVLGSDHMPPNEA